MMRPMSDPEETMPFTHQPYGKDSGENPFVSPSGPAAQPSGPQFVTPPPPPPPQVPYGAPMPGPPYAYGWRWHGGWAPWNPVFFVIGIWFVAFAVLGPWRRRSWYSHGDLPPSFDEWHRRAHERMGEGATPPRA